MRPGRGCGSPAKCEAIFRLQEPKKRMRDQAAHACRSLCRARVAEELQRRRGTRIGEGSRPSLRCAVRLS
jgi:hypothetical protein